MSRVRVLNAQPWRFSPGDHVYVRSWPQDQTVLITGRASHVFPHYFVVDSEGHEWLIAQLEMSTTPIDHEP
jgi:hypothetical protein